MYLKKRKKNDLNKNENENFVPKAFQKSKINNKSKFKKKELKEKDILKNGKIKKKRKLIKVIFLLMLILILFIGIKAGITAFRWKSLASKMVLNQNSVVLDKNNNKIATIGYERKSINVSKDAIPDNLKNAYIAIEDQRFYSHGGIDIKRTTGAIFSYIIHFGSSKYGGSTITQQYVKNVTGDNSDTISRKINEWWKAFIIEKDLSKDEILCSYLNIIYTGPNMYGVGSGAKYYFNKEVSELSLAESAYLAGINHSPNSYNPFSNDDNDEKIKKRTKTVLAKMLELKYITNDEYNNSVEEVNNGIKFVKGEIDENKEIYSYHTDALINEVINDICEKYKISKSFANNYLAMAGLTINSTQDSKVQKEVETECKKSKYILESNNGNSHSQAAMVIIEPSTGYVVGCTGGLGEKEESRTLNRATQSIRQTGSAIKPISVLAPAIDKKIITCATILDDTEKDYDNGYHPTDYNKALGNITVRRAVESSQNIPFVDIMEMVTPKTSIKYLKKMGITTLTKEDESLVLALGGLEDGISPIQMAGAYNVISNDGIYIEPTFYTEVKDTSGDVLLKSKQVTRKVFSKEVAYVLKELLTEPVNGENGTATYCKIDGVEVAAKTGTTDENYDRWLCGFTPYYTAVTWYGYDKNESIYFNKRNPAGLIWANTMSRIHTGLKSAEFKKPASVTSYEICKETGLRAKTGCNNTYTEYFLKGTEPSLCNIHSGNEINKKDENKTILQEIVEGINNEIDEEDPQVKQIETNKVENNSNTSNIVNTTTRINNQTNNSVVNNAKEEDKKDNTTTLNETNTNANNSNENQIPVNENNNINNMNVTNNTNSNTENTSLESEN